MSSTKAETKKIVKKSAISKKTLSADTEILTADSFRVLVSKKIFRPMGMTKNLPYGINLSGETTYPSPREPGGYKLTVVLDEESTIRLDEHKEQLNHILNVREIRFNENWTDLYKSGILGPSVKFYITESQMTKYGLKNLDFGYNYGIKMQAILPFFQSGAKYGPRLKFNRITRLYDEDEDEEEEVECGEDGGEDEEDGGYC